MTGIDWLTLSRRMLLAAALLLASLTQPAVAQGEGGPGDGGVGSVKRQFFLSRGADSQQILKVFGQAAKAADSGAKVKLAVQGLTSVQSKIITRALERGIWGHWWRIVKITLRYDQSDPRHKSGLSEYVEAVLENKQGNIAVFNNLASKALARGDHKGAAKHFTSANKAAQHAAYMQQFLNTLD